MQNYNPLNAAVAGLTDDPYARLKTITDKWKQFPGRAPNGTGETGLASGDAQGWSDMLNEQTEGLNIQNELQGKGPMNVRVQYSDPLSSVEPVSNINMGNKMKALLAGVPVSTLTYGMLPGQKAGLQSQLNNALKGIDTSNPNGIDMGPGYETHDQFMARQPQRPKAKKVTT